MIAAGPPALLGVALVVGGMAVFLGTSAVVAAPVIPLSGAAVHQHPAQQAYYMEMAARLRRERYRPNINTTTQQLHISPGNGTITVRGSVHPLDDTGGATVGGVRYQVNGSAVEVDGVWYYPEPPPPSRPPRYMPSSMEYIDTERLVSITVPSAIALLLVILCCMACTHRRCWCCGLMDPDRTAIKQLLHQLPHSSA